MSLYFNEIDAHKAGWLRNLFPGATVDERSIVDVGSTNLDVFERVHLFAGIGGWQYALQLAGWPDGQPVWTGSCPCQPFSVAGKGKGEADSRHLWPQFFRLIRKQRPSVIFGEQVGSSLGLQWLDGVFADLEAIGYACGAADLPAACAGAPHLRQRLFWVADANSERRERERLHLQPRESRQANIEASRRATPGRMDNANSERDAHEGPQATAGAPAGMQEEPGQRQWLLANPWESSDIITCLDGNSRRTQPGLRPLAHGVLARASKLRAYGDAIVPQVAVVFIRAYMDTRLDHP